MPTLSSYSINQQTGDITFAEWELSRLPGEASATLSGSYSVVGETVALNVANLPANLKVTL